MNHLIETEGRVYLLAASAAGGRVAVYGQTLFEVCRFHELSLRRIRSVEAKALERGRYALFMLSQIENFDSRDRLWALGEQGKITLSGAGRGLPDVPPSGGRAAAAVSPAVKQIRTIPHSECGD